MGWWYSVGRRDAAAVFGDACSAPRLRKDKRDSDPRLTSTKFAKKATQGPAGEHVSHQGGWGESDEVLLYCEFFKPPGQGASCRASVVPAAADITE